MSEVRLTGVSKRYDAVSRPALESLDLTIPSGELAVLVGPSGCGKSTTLRIVAGLEEATTGKVFIGDTEVTNTPPADRDIAMVFQSYALYPHMSVFDNLAFALRIQKRDEKDIRSRVQQVARSLSIDSYLERKPKALSGGQRQRVAIGRAVVRNPKVFLFDEPLSNLDAKLRCEMRKEISRIHNLSAETTSLYVTHDQIEAMTLADRIIVLKDGLVQQVGSPIEVYDRPTNRFVAGFFGTPAMNFLPAQLLEKEGALKAHGEGFSLPVQKLRPSWKQDVKEDAHLTVGIRPEAITLEGDENAPSLKASVHLREVLGAEVLLHVDSPAGELTVRAEAHTAAREGDNLTLFLPTDKLHIFDATSEKRL